MTALPPEDPRRVWLPLLVLAIFLVPNVVMLRLPMPAPVEVVE